MSLEEDLEEISNLDELDDYYNNTSDDNSETDEDDIIDDDNSILAIHNVNKDDIINTHASYHKLMNQSKKTRPYINKFEFTKVYGIRTQQILSGSNPLVKVPSHITDVKEIVKLELKQSKIPFIIRRYTSNNTYEDWRLSDFLNMDVYIKDI